MSSENVCPTNNFHPYSPQTADKIRLQPDTLGQQFTVTASRHDVLRNASDPEQDTDVRRPPDAGRRPARR